MFHPQRDLDNMGRKNISALHSDDGSHQGAHKYDVVCMFLVVANNPCENATARPTKMRRSTSSLLKCNLCDDLKILPQPYAKACRKLYG